MFGVLKAVYVHYHDPCFTSNFWSALWDILQTKVLLISAYHPQSDGQAKCTHQMLEQVLRCLLCKHPTSNWLKLLLMVEFAINSLIQDSMGKSPNDVGSLGYHYGVLWTTLMAYTQCKAPKIWSERFLTLLILLHTKIEQAQQWQKLYYDRKRVLLEFEVEGKVLLSTNHLQLDGSCKLQPRFMGPFVVQAKVRRLTYQLKPRYQVCQNTHCFSCQPIVQVPCWQRQMSYF